MESTKETLRRAMRARRAALDAASVRLAGNQLVSRLAALPVYREARVVLAYVAKDNEVSTADLIADAVRRGKRVFLPKRREGWFAEYFPGAALVAGSGGVLEPFDGELLAAAERRGVVLVPLLAWSAQGDRLGRGGGWYDRVLPRLGMVAIGAGYEFQERVHVPTEPSDVQLDYVVTESRLIECGRVLSERRL